MKNIILIITIIIPLWSVSQNNIELSDHHQGGIVFYVDETDHHGLIFLNKTYEGTWVDFMKKKGKINENNYSDWRLPSKKEMQLLFIFSLIGGFEGGVYLTSSLCPNNNVWSILMSDGGFDCSMEMDDDAKALLIRSF